MTNKDFKFRIFTGKNDCCVCGKNCPCKSAFIYDSEAKSRLSEFNEETQIELYTGFEDKNGTEIYEGDILQDIYTKKNYQVSFEKGLFFFGKFGDRKLLADSANNEVLEYFEIIGNIHKNAPNF